MQARLHGSFSRCTQSVRQGSISAIVNRPRSVCGWEGLDAEVADGQEGVERQAPRGEGRGGSFEPVKHDDDERDLAAHRLDGSRRPGATNRRSSPRRRRSPPSEPGSSGPSTRFPVPWVLASFRTRKPRRWPTAARSDARASVAPTIGSAPSVSPPTAVTSGRSQAAPARPRRSARPPRLRA